MFLGKSRPVFRLSGVQLVALIGSLMLTPQTKAHSADQLVPNEEAIMGTVGKPPTATVQEIVHPRNNRLPMDWYRSRGLIPQRPGRDSSGVGRLNTLGAVPGGQRVDPSDRGNYSDRRVLTLPGRVEFDLTGMPFVEPLGVGIRNTGKVNVINPWVVANGVGNWYSVATILQEVRGSEREAEALALRIWEFLRNNRYHWYPVTEDIEVHSPVKFLNVWGYGFCDDTANNTEVLAKAAGFTGARVWGLNGHVVAELYYNKGWHMFDPDMEVFAPLKPSNTGQASVAQIAADPDLNTRVGAGVVSPFYASTADNVTYQGWWDGTQTMAMTLRPGESLMRRFGNWGKYAAEAFPDEEEPPLYGNGIQRWEANFALAEHRGGLASISNGQWHESAPALRAADPDQPLSFRADMVSAYAVVGGKAELDFRIRRGERLRIYGRRIDETTPTLLQELIGPYDGKILADLDPVIGRLTRRPGYGYVITGELIPAMRLGPIHPPVSSGIRGIILEAEVQLAPAALPRLSAGRINTVDVNFSTETGGQLEVTFDWNVPFPVGDETPGGAGGDSVRKQSGAEPIHPIYPLNGATHISTAPTLIWSGGPVGDNEAGWRAVRITYDPMGRKPVSPVLMPRGIMGNSFDVPFGWLFPERTYYWQVREGDNREPRSQMFRFTTAPDGFIPAGVADWHHYEKR